MELFFRHKLYNLLNVKAFFGGREESKISLVSLCTMADIETARLFTHVVVDHVLTVHENAWNRVI